MKRSLSCDPIRRPTLPQILSIMKKDTKVVTLMTGKRLGGPSNSVVGQQTQPKGVADGNGRERRFWGSMESIDRCPQAGEYYKREVVKLSETRLILSLSKIFHAWAILW